MKLSYHEDKVYDRLAYLATSLKRNPHQLRTNRINRIDEIPEERYIAFTQLREIVTVHVRSEESVRDVSADVLQCCCDLLDWVEEIYCDEFDARIDPGVWEGASGGDDDFGPGYPLVNFIQEMTDGSCSYHSALGCRMRCSMMLKPLIPLAPVTKATFLVDGAPMFA
jgi:hypothetical protein